MLETKSRGPPRSWVSVGVWSGDGSRLRLRLNFGWCSTCRKYCTGGPQIDGNAPGVEKLHATQAINQVQVGRGFPGQGYLGTSNLGDGSIN